MITDIISLRPRYGEVDKMGYVYHANYLSYFHQARNELLRKIGLDEVTLEEHNLMLPVISFDIAYKKPAHFDEPITIITKADTNANVRFDFEFTVKNADDLTLVTAKSTVVFADLKTRYPKAAPTYIKATLQNYWKMNLHKQNAD